jgi:[ribosomal protein S5]-alanine N-acetyltransferase
MLFQEPISTSRLILRPFRIRDAPRVHELLQDRQIHETVPSVPYPYNNGVAERWIATHQTIYYEERGAVYAICRKNEELIGAIALTLNRVHRSAALGYWLGVQYWNQGYCTEAAAALVDYGFSTFRCHRIQAQRFETNIGSGRVLEKIGLRQEGRLVDAFLKDGKFRTLILHGLINPGETT